MKMENTSGLNQNLNQKRSWHCSGCPQPAVNIQHLLRQRVESSDSNKRKFSTLNNGTDKEPVFVKRSR